MTTAVQEAVAGLLEAVSTPLDRNDLGRLARMHSRAQDLVEAASPAGGAVVSEAVGSTAQGLVTLLERLILDEAANPAVGITLVPAAVRLIDQASQGQPINADALLGQIEEAVNGSAGAAAPAPEPPSVAVAEAPGEPPAEVSAEAPQPTSATARVGGESPSATPPAAEEPYVSEPLVIDMSEREYLQGFLDEAAEHMDAIEAGLLELEADPSDSARINELFRPFHTIKGIAGFLNLRDINRLTHEVETMLDLGRKSELRITQATIDLIFTGVDSLKAQLAAIRQYVAAPTGGPCPQPEIVAVMGQLRQASKPGAAPPEAAQERPKLGEILVSDGAVTESQVETVLDEQAEQEPRRKTGEIIVGKQLATPGQVDQALVKQASGTPVTDQSIRVDTRKLDFLVDAVGELVIAQSMVSLTEAMTGNENLRRNVSQVTKIVRDVQETAMAMRMVPIGQTFQKMRRLVRDVSRKAGKTVELTISGEETDLDKNVIQQISDPLVHMVRNAVDHGIESPEGRRKAGKPEVGQVSLNAYHQGDSIVIEIRDDGQGLDPQQLIAKGIERGLITPDDQLSDHRAYALILQPGFSMAAEITDISGRGVGMDVVKRNVDKLRGKIEIQSEKGRGSVFQIRLPLTLAIIDGMLVRVAHERMIIPTILIEQSLRPEPKQITSVQHRGAMLQVRGELCPLVQLGALFGCGEVIDPCEHLVVIVQCEGQKIALVVEELIGQQQVVIKTLGDRFKRVQGVSGAAILGDGRVGIILEPTGILSLHNRQGSGAFSAEAGVPRLDPCSCSTSPDDQTSAPETQPKTVSESGATCPAEPVTAPV